MTNIISQCYKNTFDLVGSLKGPLEPWDSENHTLRTAILVWKSRTNIKQHKCEAAIIITRFIQQMKNSKMSELQKQTKKKPHQTSHFMENFSLEAWFRKDARPLLISLSTELKWTSSHN